MLNHYIAQTRKILLLVCLISIISAGLSACSQANSTSNPHLQQGQKPITIGISLSFSGDFSADGQAMKQGYQLWADTINAQGGLLGRQVQLVILDDKSDPDSRC